MAEGDLHFYTTSASATSDGSYTVTVGDSTSVWPGAQSTHYWVWDGHNIVSTKRPEPPKFDKRKENDTMIHKAMDLRKVTVTQRVVHTLGKFLVTVDGLHVPDKACCYSNNRDLFVYPKPVDGHFTGDHYTEVFERPIEILCNYEPENED